ncbi:hypothetical protein [Massilia consociata]|uniref:Uncharacterized protein n=1 Tax=Massilia consociata TaxID=760117 RepID=A0ABV6FJX3_9BURK
MFAATVSDFVVTFFSKLLYGSIPSCMEVLMVKFKSAVECLVRKSNSVLSHLATKTALLALGLWCLPLQPYARFCTASSHRDMS